MTKSFIIVLLIVLVLLGGCSSSYQVGSTPAQQSFMNEELKGRDVNIELKDEKNISARVVKISGGSVSGIETHSDSTFSIAAIKIKTISYKNHWIGGAEGFGFGATILGGVGIALSGGKESHIGIPSYLPALLGGALGGVLGGGIGLIIGHSYNYEFPLAEQRDSLQNSKSP